MECDLPCGMQHLELRDFRCFPEISIDFHPRLTVFVAPNGGGKTALLDGIAASLRLFVDIMEGKKTSPGFVQEDIRQVLTPRRIMEPAVSVSTEGNALLLGQEVTWQRELARRSAKTSPRTTTAQAQQLKDVALRLSREHEAWVARKRETAPLYPLIAYYGTGRLWGASRGSKKKEKTPNARFRGYTDCLSSTSHYKGFLDWFARFASEALQEQQSKRPSPHAPRVFLEAVCRAVDTVLLPSTGWHDMEWDFAEERARAFHESFGFLPVDLLSDGIRTMIGLVGDLAYRATLLNPHLEEKAVSGTPGIVLIDEIDMHLHPGWQQHVLLLLQKAFPLVQFIVTTHSPQVLSTVERGSIRILSVEGDEIGLEIPSFQTRGVESTDVLSEIMGVDSVPLVEEAGWVSEYKALVESGKAEEARALELRQKLENHFGKQHPIMMDCDRLFRFQKYKLSSNKSEIL